MEEKKSKKADLESKRTLFIMIGLVAAIGAILLVLNIGKEVSGVKMIDGPTTGPETEVIDIMSTKAEKQLPPPKPYISQTLVITDDPTDFEEPEIESTEIFPGDIIDAISPVETKQDNQKVIDSIFVKVEENPEFPGGEKALLYWVANEIKYPSEALRNEVEGIVYVNFIVDRDGGISNARVLRAVDPALDEEALRVVSNLPKWQPGMQRGKPVRVSFTIPIRFKLMKS